MSPEQIDVTSVDAPPAAEKAVPAAVKQPGAALRAFKQGNWLLVLLFAAGIACVYLLSLRHGPVKASGQQRADDVQVESVLVQLRGQAEAPETPAAKAGALIDTFYFETRQRQIPLDQLVGNPFQFKTPRTEAPQPVTAPSTEQDNYAGDVTRYSEAMIAVKQLRLQSILAGPRGATAMISNNLLTEGQVIYGWTIRKITPRSVTLTWKDQTYELKMQ